MKNKLLYVALTSLGLLAASCSDSFLNDKKMYNKYDDSIFSNETQTGWYIDKIYYDFFNGYNSPGKVVVGKWEDRANYTEEVGGIRNEMNPQLEYSAADQGDSYYGDMQDKVQNNPYTRIRNCTYLIDNIDEKGTEISESFKKTAKGQMYFFRALQYFDLIRVYGGVPLVTTCMELSATDESQKLPRASVTECVKQVISDLSNAASLLPDKWDNANYGRLSRAAALAMKSRVLLTYASPLYNKNWDNESDHRWDLALEAGLTAERELTNAGYGLYGSSAKDWADMFLIDNAYCKEVLMVNLMSVNTSTAQNNGWENSIRLKSQSGGSGVKAPQEMIDLFPMADGKRPTDENGYDPLAFFIDRDPRFYRTFAFSGCVWPYIDKTTQTINDTVWAYRYLYDGTKKAYSNNNDVNCPAFVWKMSNFEANNTAFKYSGTDVVYYRYAELILNIAECYAAKGETGKCREYLEKLRARVGIPEGIDYYGIGNLADKYAALEACLYERRVELAYEGVRTWDMKRWMLYDDTDNNTCAKLGVTPLNGTSRTGHYWQAKVEGTSKLDPLAEVRKDYGVKLDSDTFEEDLQELAQFYKENFELIELTAEGETPLDNVKNEAVNILFRPQYYIWGLKTATLAANPWLTQTKLWTDASSASGTFDWRDDEVLNIE